MDVNECKQKGIIRKTRIDTNLVKSLVELSNIKAQTVKQTVLDDMTVNAFLPMAYDSLRELLEGYCVLFGFKVLNHDCLGKLMKQLNPKFDLVSFDRFRFVRNSINYYGTKIGLEEGQKIITALLKMREDMLQEVEAKL